MSEVIFLSSEIKQLSGCQDRGLDLSVANQLILRDLVHPDLCHVFSLLAVTIVTMWHTQRHSLLTLYKLTVSPSAHISLSWLQMF